jgi:phosphoribosylformylglycinamidine synthase
MAEVTARPRVLVVQFPGVNCEYETARVLRSVGLDAAVVRWNAPDHAFANAAAFVIPGGFSYEDRVRGGAIAAREPVMERLARAAREGTPLLGICNGAQVLVEAGLVPGGDDPSVRLALAPNRMEGRQGYYTRWVHLAVTEAPSIFTATLTPGEVLPMPMAHGEGRFTSADAAVREALVANRTVPLRYGRVDGGLADGFPDDPNGSLGHSAAVVSENGRVMALMPHPERAAWLWQVPAWLPGEWGVRRREWSRASEPAATAMTHAGPGRAIFAGLAAHLGVEVT